MRKILSIWVAKILIIISRILGKTGASGPGKVALKIYPNILRDLAGQVPKIVVVCGTNGKTTTNNLIAYILDDAVCNRAGANMLEGVATAFIASAGFFGKIKAEFAAIEVDEAHSVRVFEHLTPNFIVITNLFRDQLDRFGEVETMIDKLIQAIEMAPDAELILNADDPLVTSLAKRKSHFFGVNEKSFENDEEQARDGRFCRNCDAELEYEFYHYSQLGDYKCPACEFARPDGEFMAEYVSLRNGIHFDVSGHFISVKYRGFYNIYNILGAFAASRLMGVSTERIDDVLSSYKPQMGRMQEFSINGKSVVLNLSKNPAGFDQAIQTLLEDDSRKSIIIAINDNAGDGKDVSWLWDVNFERIRGLEIALTGIRRYDMQLRLKYAGFDMCNVYDDMGQAIRSMLETDCEVLYVLVNYTALFSTHEILRGLAE